MALTNRKKLLENIGLGKENLIPKEEYQLETHDKPLDRREAKVLPMPRLGPNLVIETPPKPILGPFEEEDLPVILHSMARERDQENIKPFFVSLAINDLVLHNCMIDTGSSANVMPLSVMKQLGLKISRPYGNVCGMDSRQIKVHEIIKNIFVSLEACPDKTFYMDIIVIDVPPSWGMLLSRKWAAELGGRLQNDFTYITVPLGANEYITLNNELERMYHVEDPTEPFNQILYVEKDLGSFVATTDHLSPIKEKSELWTLHFDGAKSRRGAGAGIVITSPQGEHKMHTFRLEFECTNNIAEYEALLIGLEISRESKIKQLKVIGDSDLIVSQIKGKFVTKNDRLRNYKNAVLDTIDLFDAFSITAVPRE